MHAGAPLGTMLNFMLQLGFREVGRPFALAELDATQRTIAADMALLGLVMPFKCASGACTRAFCGKSGFRR
jgi:hypothetical protein